MDMKALSGNLEMVEWPVTSICSGAIVRYIIVEVLTADCKVPLGVVRYKKMLELMNLVSC